MIVKITIYALSERDVRKKIKEWYSDEKNLQIYHVRPSSLDETYDVTFSYDEK